MQKMSEKYAPVHIDYKAVQRYFKQLSDMMSPKEFSRVVEQCIEVIDMQHEMSSGDENLKLMYARGFMMLLTMENLAEN